MPVVIAVWPNNTISVLRMSVGFTMLDLFTEVEHEAAPLDATCYLAKSDDDGMHITFDWKCLDDGSPVQPKSQQVGIGKISGRIKKLPWPGDIEKQWFRQLERDVRREDASQACRFLSAEEIPKLPSPPQPTLTVQQVRAMEKFCGVYLAFNDDGSCHYVGESENVTDRVSKSRPEIGDRMIGIVRCAKHERKRIEAYFVALLDPPGNACSTHRMASKG